MASAKTSSSSSRSADRDERSRSAGSPGPPATPAGGRGRPGRRAGPSAAGGSPCGCAGWPRDARRRWWPARPGPDVISPLEARLVRHQPGHGVAGCRRRRRSALGHDGAGVADLAAALGVEGRPVQEDLDGRPGTPLGAGAVPASPSLEHGEHPSRHLVVLGAAADEGRGTLLLEQGSVGGLVARPRRLGRGAGPLALFGHGRVEAGPVDLDTGVVGQLLGQLDREAVRVVQREGHVAAEDLRPAGDRLFQAAEPGAQGAVEARPPPVRSR